MTPDEFRRSGHALVEWIAAYRERLAKGEYRVQASVAPGEIIAALPEAAPETPESFDAVLRDLDSLILPGITHWQHPCFFGYFPTGGSLTSVLGDMLSTAFGVIGLNWQASPALTELEQVMTDWIRDLLGLSSRFSGVIQDTASAGTFVALVSARERSNGYGAARAGLQDGGAPLVVYTSAQAHSSVEKAALLAGFGREYVRMLDVDDEFRLRIGSLQEAVRRDREAGLRPCAVVATSGTTATTAMDPIEAIAGLASRERLWLHVDGAMGGAAMLLPEYRHHWSGIEQADSIVVNAHKWMTVGFDCCLYFVRDTEHLVRVMSTNPSYLQTTVDTQVRNYRDWGIPLGRRFRALKIWLALREQGADAIRSKLRRDIESARWLAQQVKATPPWRCVAPVTLQTVCIRHEPPGLEGAALGDHTRRWTQAVNDSGRAYLTPAVVNGEWMTRVSIGGEYTSHRHVAGLWDLMRDAARASFAAVAPPL
ncbi:MAG TPA: pyridoxal-dependent decarboxylase [Steroidobacteraceae bacterium]|jgi:aromatic-L-amino-acid decarboxylase|nr:pyridoxal-dependent decarboxylase [Steroidobacteraceae bacterium]